MYGALASKFGSSASKMGKKAAQSEAGRSAGRSAIKGASDAAAKDLTSRYFGEESNQPTVTSPTKHPNTPTSVQTTSNPPASYPSSHSRAKEYDSDEEYQRIVQKSEDTYHQKPSLFTRFKPNINIRGKTSEKQQSTRPKPRIQEKRKIYKYVLSKEADWGSNPQAMALYNYKAEMRCDLEFRKGQVIQVMTRTDSQNDWWEGRIEDRVGIFPANYVNML